MRDGHRATPRPAGSRGISVLLAALLLLAMRGTVGAQSTPTCPDVVEDHLPASVRVGDRLVVGPQGPVSVHVGDRLVVGVQGYGVVPASWELDDAEMGGVLRLVGKEYVPFSRLTPTPTFTPTPTPTQAVTPGPYDNWQILPVVPGFREPQILGGGRGRQCWTFEAIASGRTTISMSLRGGDITSPPSDTAQITVIVLPPGAPAQVPWP